MRTLLTPLITLVCLQQAQAHYHLLLPDKPSAKTGDVVTLTLQFGHPYEHQLFDCDQPSDAYALAPDNTQIDLMKTIRNATMDDKKAFKFSFTPEQRGDYVVVVITKEFKLEDKKQPLIDIARTTVHVQTQKAWDRPSQLGKETLRIDAVPLTRPYGLRAGMVFQTVVTRPPQPGEMTPGKARVPVGTTLVEVEKYNPSAPKELPSDELITFTCHTDDQGVATATLLEPGWWAVTSYMNAPDFIYRVTQWVLVDK